MAHSFLCIFLGLSSLAVWQRWVTEAKSTGPAEAIFAGPSGSFPEDFTSFHHLHCERPCWICHMSTSLQGCSKAPPEEQLQPSHYLLPSNSLRRQSSHPAPGPIWGLHLWLQITGGLHMLPFWVFRGVLPGPHLAGLVKDAGNLHDQPLSGTLEPVPRLSTYWLLIQHLLPGPPDPSQSALSVLCWEDESAAYLSGAWTAVCLYSFWVPSSLLFSPVSTTQLRW